MGKITQAQAEKAAERYLEAVADAKNIAEEVESSVKILRDYCDQNEDVEIIGKCLVYTKSLQDTIKGKKADVEKFTAKLPAKYLKDVADLNQVNNDKSAIKHLKGLKLTKKKADVSKMKKYINKDNSLVQLLDDHNVKLSKDSEFYFKHV